ncbi:MAG TPA: S8 family serine peptidase, partial [candidate division Zixibacteria bacterium]|nr:S8 family serine peptidase [candidate division Zixibacteria bacterium]
MATSYVWRRLAKAGLLIVLLVGTLYFAGFLNLGGTTAYEAGQNHANLRTDARGSPDPGSDTASLLATVQPDFEDQSSVVILFDSMPVSGHKAAMTSSLVELTSIQQNQLRRRSLSLTRAHQRFLDELRQLDIHFQLNYEYTYLLNGLAITLDSDEVDGLTEMPSVSGVYPDSPVHLNLTESIPLIGADQVWVMTDDLGRPITGQGIRVAIIDTGIDYTHPDLGGCFGPGCKVVDGYDLRNNDPDPMDDGGHGTHCAGVVAASGTMTGVAPEASLLAYKVLDGGGYGSISVIIAGIERAADPDQDPASDDAVDIISMSLGYAGSPGDPWSLAVAAAAEQGILVATAAGNQGPGYSNLDSPGLEAKALTVGASDKNDVIATFSSRGPVPGYPEVIKPDIVAPGVGIISTWLSGGYASSDGTSMATPHVAGAAALVWQAHPEWTAEMVQANLMNTAVDLGLNVHTQGAGRVQVDTAMNAPAVVTPGSLGLGMVEISQPEWLVSRNFRLTNVSASEKSYTLSLTGPLLSGESAWPIIANLSSSALSLEAGQSASITLTVTIEPAHIPPDLDRNEGKIVVQSGTSQLTVPFAFQLPPIFIANQLLPYSTQSSYAVELGDLDGDGDLDAFVGNADYYGNPANTVWLNDGSGLFSDSGQRLGNSFTWSIALGDLDGDGDLDAFEANGEEWDPLPNKVWLNDGHGAYSDSGQSLGTEVSRGVALGDLDGDGDLDAFVANGDPSFGGGEANSVWFNNGSALFSKSGQTLGKAVSQDIALGDLDGDGDLDAFVANGDPERGRGEANKVWLNNGQGLFTDSGRSLGTALSQAVALGDLDGDSDLDALVANGGPEFADGQPDRLWLNDGSAVFTVSGQLLGSQSSFGVALADIHADGLLDVFIAGYRGGNKVWLNDGSANLSLSDPGFATESAANVALGDVDGDGDVDALVANAIGRENRLWLNRGSGLPVSNWPAAPTHLYATSDSQSEIDLSWQDNATDETAYHIERSPNGSTWADIATVTANTTTFSDDSLTCGTSYYYRVRGYRSSDGTYSSYSNVASETTLPCTLGAPTNLIATAGSQNEIDLSWQDNATDETAYHIERSPDGSVAWAEIDTVTANTTTLSDDSLTCGTSYYYRVRGYRSSDGGYSSYSNVASETTLPCTLEAPTNLNATAGSQTEIDLSWQDNATYETAYLIERSPNGTSSWTQIDTVPADSTLFSDTTLSCGTSYYY